MKQIDIFGNEHDIEELEVAPKSKSYKEMFRAKYGFKKGYICKNCKYRKSLDYHYKHYHKCEKLGISNSSSTDIRLSDEACNLYEELLKGE